jgi:hypothetical protein
MKMTKEIQNIMLDIYEISIALQWIPTDRHLEKKSPKILGEMLEKEYEKLISLLFK